MNEYARIENLFQEKDKRQVVFCAIYSISKPWINFQEIPKSQRGIEIPLALMQVRWDGFIGFPGGNVDDGETLWQAIVREVKEEINYNLDLDRTEVLCSLTDGTKNIHCFCMQVNTEEMKEIIINAAKSEHFLVENQGCFAAQIAHFQNENGLKQFAKHNFKASAKVELEILIEERLKLGKSSY